MPLSLLLNKSGPMREEEGKTGDLHPRGTMEVAMVPRYGGTLKCPKKASTPQSDSIKLGFWQGVPAALGPPCETSPLLASLHPV